jgi:hypothetical protein
MYYRSRDICWVCLHSRTPLLPPSPYRTFDSAASMVHTYSTAWAIPRDEDVSCTSGDVNPGVCSRLCTATSPFFAEFSCGCLRRPRQSSFTPSSHCCPAVAVESAPLLCPAKTRSRGHRRLIRTAIGWAGRQRSGLELRRCRLLAHAACLRARRRRCQY